ncbi:MULTISPECIES: hypothetical protein [unclassified Bradyrhizobium]|uniref:hypothetical protein n=1 Tax=unclassified Bradyrhizobium TaxID=2631580 RepID=UPI001CD70B19|nr:MULTISPECIES: hypothetical protein [unclassified Bradyrhizobium]MCA1377646.1 hypothetical protein [Bradyrhizobium sp. IC4060]MCA1483129.1 hypothetical protein [Bradyrhizobium sp. IC4061]
MKDAREKDVRVFQNRCGQSGVRRLNRAWRLARGACDRWIKEAWFAASKDRKEAEYLAMRLVLIFDGLVNDCYNAVHDPLMPDQEGISQSTVANPELTMPEGDYKALPRPLMYEVLSMPNRLDSIKEGLASAWEYSGPPDFDEFYECRKEHWSRLGLKALAVIDTLCETYKIPRPERPEYYTPWQSFQDEVASIAKAQRESGKRNREIAEEMTRAMESGAASDLPER